MKNVLKYQNWLRVFFLWLLFIVIMSLFAPGCYTPSKAHKQGSRWITTYTADAAATTRNIFPCVPLKADTVFKSDSSDYIEVLNAIQDELFNSNITNDSLQQIIASKIILSPNLDSLCNDYVILNDELKKQNKELVYRLTHLPPIKTTATPPPVIDKADVTACENIRDKAIETANTETKERKSWQKKAKTRWWVNFGLIFLIVGYAGAKIYSFFKAKPKT